MEIAKVFMFVGVGFISPILFILGVKLLRSDSGIYNSNRSFAKNLSSALRGLVCKSQESARGFRCNAGMVYNKKTGKIVFQGKLSDEAVRDVIG